jgi:hypothetical protein
VQCQFVVVEVEYIQVTGRQVGLVDMALLKKVTCIGLSVFQTGK